MSGRLRDRFRAEAAALRHHAPGPAPRPRPLAEIALGGAVGALARHLLTEAIPASAKGFPWNTLTVNMLGCLAMGVLTAYLLGGRPHPVARPLAVTGYLGGFTTFSHLIDGVHVLGAGGRAGLAAGYAAGSLAGGWLMVAAGLAAGGRIPRRDAGEAG